MSASVPKPIAFVAMPFRTRSTGLAPGKGPSRVDFDALWDKAIAPALHDLGFVPIRADNQDGSVIIKDMLEQLVYAQLVVAEISIDNANVYYEAGVRHAAKAEGCVLIAAEWATPVFDLKQIRQVRYPLAGESPGDDAYLAIREALKNQIGKMEPTRSPVYELTSYPDDQPSAEATSFRQATEALASFQEGLRGARLKAPDDSGAAIRELIEAFENAPQKRPVVAKELLWLVRDRLGWAAAKEFIGGLPERLQQDPFFVEQRSLAQSKIGDVTDAIAALETLIETHGETPERCGLLGGRHKALFNSSKDRVKRARHLDQAIGAYTRGMELDLNQYFNACNLPRLLKTRDDPGDRPRAEFIGQLTVAACERARSLEEADEWLKPTLLGASFDAEDERTAEELYREIRGGDHESWHLESTIADLRLSVNLIQDEAKKQPFGEILNRLTKLVWIPQSELLAKLGEQLRTGGKRHKKTKNVRARVAKGGEQIVSITEDGTESSNVASAGDYIVENETTAGEQYIVTAGKFAKRYREVSEVEDDWKRYAPTDSAVVLALPIDASVLDRLGKGRTFYIEAPWGQAQRVNRDDYFVAPLDLGEIYRIGKPEFEQTYSEI